jgi:hypothetical protein
MTEEHDTYRTATNAPIKISRLTIEMLAFTLAKVFRRWQHTMPYYHFTEELLRRICQLALAVYEEENG